MNQQLAPKSIFASRTLWGAAIGFLAMVAHKTLSIDIPVTEQEVITNHAVTIASAIAELVAVILIVWGRIKATRPIKPLTLPGSGNTPTSLVLLVALGAVFGIMLLSGCSTNAQDLTAERLKTQGGPATLNAARWDGDVYTVTGPLHPGLAEIDEDGASFQTGGPFSSLSARASNGTLFFGAGSDYEIGSISTSVEREDQTTTMTATGVRVTNSTVLLASAKVAELLYPTLSQLSADEASVRIKQLETVGEITSTTAGLLRAWLGLP